MAVGIDANAVIGLQTVRGSKRVVGKWGLHTRNERGVLFTAWLHMVHSSCEQYNVQETDGAPVDTPVVEHR